MDQTPILHNFTQQVEVDGIMYVFKDSITVPQAQYDAMTDGEKAAERQRRVDNFVQALLPPPPSDNGNEGDV